MSGRSHDIRHDDPWPAQRSAPEATFRELDRVRTLEAVSGEDGETMPMGSEGTVVAVWNGGEAFDVEFVQPDETLAAIAPKDLQLVERTDGHRPVHHAQAPAEAAADAISRAGPA